MSLHKQQIEEYADKLKASWKQKTTISPLTETEKDISIEDAYQIQLSQVNQRQVEGEVVIGKKIGLTSQAMQDMLGVNEPDYGHLFNTMVVAEEEKVKLDSLIQPKCEAEIAFLLAEDLKGPGITIADVMRATKGVIPSFEVIDSRIEDWNLKIQDTIADNASSGLIVLGSQLTLVEEIDLKHTGLVLRKNGEVLDTAAGAAVMGNPAQAVAWLANKLAKFNIALEAGEIILSGSLTGAFPIASGDNATASFDGLGSVNIVFE